MSASEFEKYDVRVIQRALRNGTIDQESYSAWLAQLPDEASYAAEAQSKISSTQSERRREVVEEDDES